MLASKKYHVRLSQEADLRSQSLPAKAFLDFRKKRDLLQEDGYLENEIPVPVPVAGDDFFAFEIEGGWVAIAQRQKSQDWLGNWKIEIEVVNLVTASEFDRISGRTTPRPTGVTQLLRNVWIAIAPLRHDSRWVGIVLAFAITLVAVVKSEGVVKFIMETDGNQIKNEVIIDNRESE
ncbi:hypothetical protein [Roseofilum casamattae]|uniref:Uncharacterized protein n=1 Tax=Roseofilum casamattae BLCC-M143 TaxID=3022442 RepID=A0ABT7C2E6_9CYAN|nr:hypothetical protein [Roseofilum casamattae]MDJ1184703.1 hypothetical protein [Roseofilum casamattae BLCC-M143]